MKCQLQDQGECSDYLVREYTAIKGGSKFYRCSRHVGNVAGVDQLICRVIRERINKIQIFVDPKTVEIPAVKRTVRKPTKD